MDWTEAHTQGDEEARHDAKLFDARQARQRLDAGEPFNTTAAELGLTPHELEVLLEEINP